MSSGLASPRHRHFLPPVGMVPASLLYHLHFPSSSPAPQTSQFLFEMLLPNLLRGPPHHSSSFSLAVPTWNFSFLLTCCPCLCIVLASSPVEGWGGGIYCILSNCIYHLKFYFLRISYRNTVLTSPITVPSNSLYDSPTLSQIYDLFLFNYYYYIEM